MFNLIFSYFILEYELTETYGKIFTTFMTNYKIDFQVRSEIPYGAGLGSSAAYTITLTASLLVKLNLTFRNYLVLFFMLHMLITILARTLTTTLTRLAILVRNTFIPDHLVSITLYPLTVGSSSSIKCSALYGFQRLHIAI
jgi:hypothetical protein